MRSYWLRWYVLALLVITVALFVWHRYGMNHAILIDPNAAFRISTDDDRHHGGKSVANYEITDDGIVLLCDYDTGYPWPYCHLNIHLAEGDQGVDLSKFSYALFDIDSGEDEPRTIRIFIRNFHPAYSDGTLVTLKPNTMQYIPQRQEHPLRVSMDLFQVASWWVTEYFIPPEHSSPDLSNVTMIQISTGGVMAKANYRVVVKSVEFHGKWVSDYQLLLIILALWVSSALFYLSNNFWLFYKSAQQVKEQKLQLEKINSLLKLERQELKQLAMYDSLTGALNRVGVRDSLYKQVSMVNAGEASLSVMFMDVDHFKSINDGFGHEIGDEVLRAFVALVQDNTRDKDYLCRWGGEEFILLCHDTKIKQAYRLAEKLRQRIQSHSWPANIELTCSFGVAQMDRDEDVNQFFKRADNALYKAKSAGRNRVIPDGIPVAA